MLEKIEEAMQSALAWAVASALGGMVYLFRRVFTNQKQIEMLQNDLKNREQQRQEDRERMTKIEEGVTRIEGYIMTGNLPTPPVQPWTGKKVPPGTYE